MDTDYTILVTLTYIMIIIGGGAGIGLIVAFFKKLLKIYIIVLYTLELILKIGENMDIETVLIIIVVVVGVGLGIFVGGKFGKKVGNKMKDKIEDKWRK